MPDEIIKQRIEGIPTPDKGIVIHDGQLFKVQIVAAENEVRDEFSGEGQSKFDEIYSFANKLCQIYKGSRIRLLLRTRHE